MGANVCTENGCVCGSEGKTCLSTGSTPKCFSSNNTFTQNDIDATCKVGANIIHDQTTILQKYLLSIFLISFLLVINCYQCVKASQDSCKSADTPSDPTTPVCGADGVCVKCTKNDGAVGDGSEPGTCTGGMMGRYFNCYATGECKF